MKYRQQKIKVTHVNKLYILYVIIHSHNTGSTPSDSNNLQHTGWHKDDSYDNFISWYITNNTKVFFFLFIKYFKT